MELFCENGQIMMQGQSKRSPISENFHTLAPKVHYARNANGSKTTKFSMVDSISPDFQLLVPSCEMGLHHDVDDIVPSLNYPFIEDALPNEYITSDLLRVPDISTYNHLASRENRRNFQGNCYSSAVGNSISLKHGNKSEFPSGKHRISSKPTEEILSSKDKLREDVGKNDALQNPAYCATVGKPEMGGQQNKEQSGNNERSSYERKRDLKRKSHDIGYSEDPKEEVEEESVGSTKAPRSRAGLKKTRAAEVHNQPERGQRARTNAKMRVLQDLIPNCNKVDKACMLDEAIEYLKTLQLQVQMLAMVGGLYMPPMMLPPIHGAYMPHFSPVGVGMGLGFNMMDYMRLIPFQGPHYPISNMGPTFPGMPGSSFHAFGQGLPMPTPMQQPPALSDFCVPSMDMPNLLGVSGSTNAAPLVPSICSKRIG